MCATRRGPRSANVESLEEIARHARRVVWMTPEPRWGWALGGCDMERYAPLCDRVGVVRTADERAGTLVTEITTRRSG